MLFQKEVSHFHLFCGLGGGALGFNRGHARVGNTEAKFQCLGGIDVDPSAIADFQRLTGTPGTVLDMFSRDQYTAFYEHEPPSEWKEATPADIQAAAGNQRPNIIFLSAPCKGFSGLLSQTRSTTPKYQALNQLTVRGMWLALEAWADDPPELIIFENVPRIASRGRELLNKITSMLQRYGYHVAETTHDCGEIGHLAQSRKRFLLVARHAEKVPPFLYEPIKRPLRAVGDVLGEMPMPGDELAGPMHRVPRLQWKTWVRLAFVEAGSDWRSLNKLAVEDGYLSDYLIVPDYRSGYMGVNQWHEPMGTVAGRSTPTNGAFSIADPRFNQSAKWKDGQAYGVRRWEGPTYGKYAITQWDKSTGTVISGSTTGQGAFGVADPRPGLSRSKGDHYLTAGHYGVVLWHSSCGAVSASTGYDNGNWSIADPRLPEPNDKLVAVIHSLDGTWHRPFTTLELAALQGLVDPCEHLELEGLSDSAWRERIGNAVPAPAAEAIANVMGTTLLLAWSGETFALGNTPIWVRNVAASLALQKTPHVEN